MAKMQFEIMNEYYKKKAGKKIFRRICFIVGVLFAVISTILFLYLLLEGETFSGSKSASDTQASQIVPQEGRGSAEAEPSAEAGAEKEAHSFMLRIWGFEEAVPLPEDGSFSLYSFCGRDRFTGMTFEIAGDQIQKAEVSVDRGALYLCTERFTMPLNEYAAKTVNYTMESEEMSFYWPEESETKHYDMYYHADGLARFICMEKTGAKIEMDYSPGTAFGLYAEKSYIGAEEGVNAERQALDYEGSRLSVSVTFEDGSVLAKNYVLHAGRLAGSFSENENRFAAESRFAEDGEESVYGVLAVPAA
ncbi:MAG: hypothetical protein K6E30_06130 [Lachnospiraceae bacterium]|nr:hypothetical protein [Lachnospiraceae bacterium]